MLYIWMDGVYLLLYVILILVLASKPIFILHASATVKGHLKSQTSQA